MPTRVRQAGCLGNVSITRPTNSLHMLEEIAIEDTRNLKQ